MLQGQSTALHRYCLKCLDLYHPCIDPLVTFDNKRNFRLVSCRSLSLIHLASNRGSRIRFPAGSGNFSLHHRVQNGSGAHPASCPVGTRGYPWRLSGRRGVKLTTNLHLVPRSRIRGAVPPLSHYAFMAWCSVKAQGQL
jgi:hypothetical protein